MPSYLNKYYASRLKFMILRKNYCQICIYLNMTNTHCFVTMQHLEAVLNDKYVELVSQVKCFSFSCVWFSFIITKWWSRCYPSLNKTQNEKLTKKLPSMQAQWVQGIKPQVTFALHQLLSFLTRKYRPIRMFTKQGYKILTWRLWHC